MRKLLLICSLVTCIAFFTACEEAKQDVIIEQQMLYPQVVSVSEEPVVQEAFVQSFDYYSISQEVKQRINGVSWREGCPVQLEELCYVKVAYWGFDDQPHMGELIVHKQVAEDIVEIFEELYEAKYPIEKIRLVDDYEAKDDKSMEDNNTSAFNYRDVEGKPGKLSKHSYGLAIDINPVQNPYVYKDKVSPIEGKAYTDRNKLSKGMIQKDDVCYKAFTSRGWTWGGDWRYEKDYQHFQKSIVK